MDLKFLKHSSAEKLVVKEPGEGGKGKVVDITYDKSMGDLEQPQFVSDKPYIGRAVCYCADFKIPISKNLKEALISRGNGNMCLTLHEADIAYRGHVDLSIGFVQRSFMLFTSMVTEDDHNFTSGIFLIRSRYNSGLQWKTKTLPELERRKETARIQNGFELLTGLEKSMRDLGLPLHAEEVEGGIDQEFLKPEYMNWQQFTLAHKLAKDSRSISEKQFMELAT